jgi:hypothetical protein
VARTIKYYDCHDDLGDQIGRNFAIWVTFYRPRRISGDKYGLLFKYFKSLERFDVDLYFQI